MSARYCTVHWGTDYGCIGLWVLYLTLLVMDKGNHLLLQVSRIQQGIP